MSWSSLGRRNMPDLEDSIRDWRRQMRAAGIKSPVPLDELENHLREDVEQRMKSGASAQGAFDAAVQRIGHASTLKAEFAKVGEVMSARQRNMNWLVCATASFFYGALGVMILFPRLIGPLAFRERMLMAGASVLVAMALCSWRYFCRFLPVIFSKRKRTAVAFLSIIIGSICMAGLQHFDPGTFTAFTSSASVPISSVIAVLWALLPGAIVLSVIIGLEEAAYRKIATHDL